MEVTSLVTFISDLTAKITGAWSQLAASAGGIIIYTAAGVAIIGYAISGLWRMFSKRKRGSRG